MKFTTFALLFAAAPLFAQATAQHTPPKTINMQPEDLARTLSSGCPVQLSKVSLTRPPRLVLASGWVDGRHAKLSLQYANTNGKDIQFIEVKADLLVKKSIYELDATKIGVDLVLWRGGVLARGGSESQALPVKGDAFGLSTVDLEQVVFTDGTTWTPSPSQMCEFPGYGGFETHG